MKINYSSEREIYDEDTYLCTVTAERNGIKGYGTGYTMNSAMDKATKDLEKKEKGMLPISVNWENTPESFLCKIDVREAFFQ